jgi:hypothetical protein
MALSTSSKSKLFASYIRYVNFIVHNWDNFCSTMYNMESISLTIKSNETLEQTYEWCNTNLFAHIRQNL